MSDGRLAVVVEYRPGRTTSDESEQDLWEKVTSAHRGQHARGGEASLPDSASFPWLKCWTWDAAMNDRCRRGGRRRPRRRYRNLVAARNRRASRGMTNCRFQEGDANLSELADRSFDLVVSIFGAMFAPKPFDVAKEMARNAARRPDRWGTGFRRSDTRGADSEGQLATRAPPRVCQPTRGIEPRSSGCGGGSTGISFSSLYAFSSPGAPSAFVADLKTTGAR